MMPRIGVTTIRPDSTVCQLTMNVGYPQSNTVKLLAIIASQHDPIRRILDQVNRFFVPTRNTKPPSKAVFTIARQIKMLGNISRKLANCSGFFLNHIDDRR